MDDDEDHLISVTPRHSSRLIENQEQQLTEPAVFVANFSPEWKTKVSFCLVLLTETLERTAFYGILCNMVLFLNANPMLWASYNAVESLFVLNGISYVFAIFGGWLADACLGKFRTIVFFFLIYIVGFIFWPFFYPYPVNDKKDVVVPSWCAVGKNNSVNFSSGFLKVVQSSHSWIEGKDPTNDRLSEWEVPSIPWWKESCSWAVYLSIAVIAVGYGSVRANIIPFGAHQFEHEGRTAVRVYFNWFYWSINIGALVAYGALGYVQQEISYFWGFLAPLIILIIALFTFVSGSCIFVKKSATGSVLTNIMAVCKESLVRYCHRRRRRDIEVLNSAIGMLSERAPCCLDFARARFGGSFTDNAVDDIKQLGKIIVIFLSMIPYWTVYYQVVLLFYYKVLNGRSWIKYPLP